MLGELKKAMEKEKTNDLILEAMVRNTNAVKNAFLDNFEMDIIGAENDPEIRSLITKIPEYDDHDEEIVKSIDKLTESIFETELDGHRP